MGQIMIRYITHLKTSFLLAVFFCSCSQERVKNIEEPRLVIEKERAAILNEKYLVKIYFNDVKYKIQNAYVDCNNDEKRELDTISYRFVNCNKLLYINRDTIKIAFTPSILGSKKFDNISIIFQDRENKLSVIDTTFYYDVVDKRN